MRRLRNGDEAAFSEFYDRHQASIYRFALHMTGRPDVASDVVQETFLTLMRQAGKFDPDKGSPAAFLYGIARNHVRRLYEYEGRFVSISANAGDSEDMDLHASSAYQKATEHHFNRASESENVLDALDRAQSVALLREAILTLPEHYREPITLCDLEGKSYEETAEFLECPVGTVRSRLNRARSILLEKLRPAWTKAKQGKAMGR
jgi:RNA polymerase sigma-70 factor, ECF subfamily